VIAEYITDMPLCIDKIIINVNTQFNKLYAIEICLNIDKPTIKKTKRNTANIPRLNKISPMLNTKVKTIINAHSFFLNRCKEDRLLITTKNMIVEKKTLANSNTVSTIAHPHGEASILTVGYCTTKWQRKTNSLVI
jgi:hypothetical protein